MTPWIHLRGPALFQLAPFVEIICTIEHDHILHSPQQRKLVHIYMYMGTQIKSQRVQSSRLRGHLTFENEKDRQ